MSSSILDKQLFCEFKLEISWIDQGIDGFIDIRIVKKYCIVQNSGGENFGEFGESEAIRQGFTHPNLHFKKLQIVDYQKFTGQKCTQCLS